MPSILKPILLVVVLAGGGFWVYQHFFVTAGGAGEATAGAWSGAKPGVVVATAEQRMISDSVDAIGTLLANESVTVTAKVTDTVKSINFEDGEFVEAGSVLVALTDNEETAQLAEAAANLDDARRQYERLEALGVNQQVSKSAIDEARARVEANQAKYNAIVARLKDRIVLAPFSGVLGFRMISPGALVSPGTPITTIDDVSTVKADFTVPEKYLSLFQVGDIVRALSDAWPGELFFGEITSIGSRIDPVTRSVTIRAVIDNEDRRLRPGMLVQIRAFSERRPKIVVPESAVIQDGEGAFLYVLEGDQAVTRRIGIEKRIPGMVVVSSGIEAGETVVGRGTFSLRSGSAVQVTGEMEIPPLPSGYQQAIEGVEE